MTHQHSSTLPQDTPTTAPPPYRVEDVVVTNGDVQLAATVTIPAGAGPFPAAVLIGGSGAHDRDEEVAGFKVFGALADALSREGVAVLRYDDRGVGGSTGTKATATIAALAEDALAAVRLLASRGDVRRGSIGLLGHSHGANVAAVAASAPAMAFIVMMAPPGIRGDHLLARQQADVARAMGATAEQMAAEQSAFRRVVDAVRANAPTEQLERAVRDQIEAQLAGRPAIAATADRTALVDSAVRMALAQMGSVAFKDLVTFDPAEATAAIRCPVLALFGGNDTQAPPDLTRRALEDAFASDPARLTVQLYPSANHLFMPAVTGTVAEYPTLPKTFVPGFVDDIVEWIRTLP